MGLTKNVANGMLKCEAEGNHLWQDKGSASVLMVEMEK